MNKFSAGKPINPGSGSVVSIYLAEHFSENITDPLSGSSIPLSGSSARAAGSLT
jgi:hypothetical protein